MKKIIFALVMFASASVQAHVINFTGDYDVANWNSATQGDGSIVTSGPLSIMLTSADDDIGFSTQEFTITSTIEGTVNFLWTYSTTDTDGAEFDPFGWTLNGSFVQLTSDKGPDSQIGVESFNVKVGDVFGFSQQAYDSLYGPATTTIQHFSIIERSVPVTAVPEPSTIALMLGGLGLIGMAAARRRRQA